MYVIPQKSLIYTTGIHGRLLTIIVTTLVTRNFLIANVSVTIQSPSSVQYSRSNVQNIT